jgi:ribonuclease BN (tRNA processing enzyme)
MGTLYLLGTGTPTPTKSRFGTSYVLQLDNDYLMFDCGPASTYKLVQAGLFPMQINNLFFTHHHFDHNADYPCFLLCRWDQSIGKERQLHVWGPPPTRWFTECLIGPDGVFSLDWKARVGAPLSQNVHVNRGGSLPRPEPSFDVSDVGPGRIMECEHWTVSAAHTHHVEPWLESLAYRVDSDEVSIVFTGDTGPCQSVHQLGYGADCMVVNCWDHQEVMEANGEVLGQTGTLDAARMAQEAGVKKLIITHTGPRLSAPGSREKGIQDMARIFKGEIIFGEELMHLTL